METRVALPSTALCGVPGTLGHASSPPSRRLCPAPTTHAQALTCTQDMMAQRVEFLLQQGLSQEEVGRAVLAHPQVLHYKIDSMRERVDYLQNVGLTQVRRLACRHVLEPEMVTCA